MLFVRYGDATHGLWRRGRVLPQNGNTEVDGNSLRDAYPGRECDVFSIRNARRERSAPTPTPTPTSVPTLTSTPTTAPTGMATATPVATPTATATMAPTASPTATPTATPTPGPIAASPNSLAFNGTSQMQNVLLTDPGFGGTYTVSGCSGIATYGAVAGNTLAVTSQSPGSCSLTIGDSFNTTSVSVTVTTASIPIMIRQR